MNSLTVVWVFSFLTLFEKNAKLGEEILEDSINLLEQFDKDLIIVQRVLKKKYKDNTVKLRVKKKIHTRITGLYYFTILLILVGIQPSFVTKIIYILSYILFIFYTLQCKYIDIEK